MSKSNIHSKIILAKAREALRPVGVTQKGRSRLWYDDKNWYTITIGFEPHKWRQGTSLVLGITWLWYPKDYWAYNISAAREKFIDFQTEEQFSTEVDSLIQQILEMLKSINAACSTFRGAYDYASKSGHSYHDPWQNLDLGILSILSGRRRKGLRLIKSVEREEVKHEWQEQRRIYCKTAIEKAQDLNEFRLWIEENIHLSRKMKKLPDCEGACLQNT